MTDDTDVSSDTMNTNCKKLGGVRLFLEVASGGMQQTMVRHEKTLRKSAAGMPKRSRTNSVKTKPWGQSLRMRDAKGGKVKIGKAAAKP